MRGLSALKFYGFEKGIVTNSMETNRSLQMIITNNSGYANAKGQIPFSEERLGKVLKFKCTILFLL